MRDPTSEPRGAGVVRRGAGYLVDATLAFGIVAMLQLVVWVPVRAAVGIGDDWFRCGVCTQLYTLATISLPVWLWFAVGDSVWRTPGRRLTGLRVVRSANGATPGVGRALGRTLVKLLPWEIAHLANNLPTPMWYATDAELRAGFLVSFTVLVAWIVVTAARRDRRGPHDLFAGTQVLAGR